MLCLIDGFNLYHSLRDCEHDTDARVRWLDLRSLCESLLHVLPGECAIGEVVYFSALAHHIEASRPGTIERHQRYMDVLRATSNGTVIPVNGDEEGILDPAGDAPADAGNTMSFTLSFERIYSEWASFGPGTFCEFDIAGATVYGDNAASRVKFVLE